MSRLDRFSGFRFKPSPKATNGANGTQVTEKKVKELHAKLAKCLEHPLPETPTRFRVGQTVRFSPTYRPSHLVGGTGTVVALACRPCLLLGPAWAQIVANAPEVADRCHDEPAYLLLGVKDKDGQPAMQPDGENELRTPLWSPESSLESLIAI